MRRCWLLLIGLVLLWVNPIKAQNQSSSSSLTINIVQHTAKLTWVASVSTEVTGYNVYRSNISGSGYTKISSVALLTYTDGTVLAGKTYFYMVRSIGSNGIESVDSNQFTAMIPLP